MLFRFRLILFVGNNFKNQIMPNSNYCLVDPQGGAIKVELTINNGIRSGALFILWEKDSNDKWIEKESFKMITGDDGIEKHILLEKPAEIENDLLAWNIKACAQINDANHGEFVVTIYQDGIKLWSKTSRRKVNYCNTGHSIFGNQVFFKHLVLPQSLNLKLWKKIEI